MQHANAAPGSKRETLSKLVEGPRFATFLTTLIVLNALVLGVLTYLEPGTRWHGVLSFLDEAITWIFVAELALKLTAQGRDFFRHGWNWFDFLVVAVSFAPGAGAFTALRALRVLRVLRLLHMVPMMKRVSEALFKALPGMGAILAVLAFVTYVGAVMATMMFGKSDNPQVVELFGSLQASAFTLFQVMTMDGWRNEVVQVVMDDGKPFAWIFFFIFIFLASFAILNLFIALIVEALQRSQEAVQEAQIAEQEDQIERLEVDVAEAVEAAQEAAEAVHAEREEMVDMIRAMRVELAELRERLMTLQKG
jgi:voltage-gated sodium channel